MTAPLRASRRYAARYVNALEVCAGLCDNSSAQGLAADDSTWGCGRGASAWQRQRTSRCGRRRKNDRYRAGGGGHAGRKLSEGEENAGEAVLTGAATVFANRP